MVPRLTSLSGATSGRGTRSGRPLVLTCLVTASLLAAAEPPPTLEELAAWLPAEAGVEDEGEEVGGVIGLGFLGSFGILGREVLGIVPVTRVAGDPSCGGF